MKILTYPLGDLATNSYVLVNETTKDAIAIDVGDSGNFLLLEGLKNDFTLKAVLLTHGHFDHIGGVSELYAKGIPVYIGEKELDFIKDSSLNLSGFFGSNIKPFEANGVKDSVTYKVENNLFCGDVLFDGSFGRVDFPTGDLKALVKSAKKLFEYKNHTLYSGHGNPTTTDKEKESNPINYYD